MELEFQAPVSDLMRVLGTELGFSERVVAALTFELSPQLFLNIFIYVDAVCVCVLRRPEEGLGYPGVGVRDVCEPPDVGIGD